MALRGGVEGRTILLKGSRSMRMEALVEDL